MAYVIEDLEHGYLQSPYVYVENYEFARVFSTLQIACDFIEFFDLDEETHRIVWDESLEPDEFENEYFDEVVERPFPMTRRKKEK